MTVRIGSYILGRCIGRGGNAAVFAARQQTSLGTTRLVALKILNRRGVGAALEMAAFRREAQLATRLEHPGIIRTYDVGEHDEQLYLAMELVLGATLARARSAVDLPTFLRIMSDVARAAHHAHELRSENGSALGIVHQDITPENVMVGYDGRVQLLDFGVARLAAVDASRTDTVRGKPAYLSPEQLEGEHIDRRTDVFALGALAYELLSGRPLFLRDSVAATYRAILLEPVPDLQGVRPDVPRTIVTVIERALTRDKAARWGTAAELANALETMSREAGIVRADDVAMAAWVARAVPATVTAAELEAEIIVPSAGGANASAGANEPAETLEAVRPVVSTPLRELPVREPLERHDETDDVALPVARRRRLVAAVMALALVLVLVVVFRARVASRHEDDKPAGSSGAGATLDAGPPSVASVGAPVLDPRAAPVLDPGAAPVPDPGAAPGAIASGSAAPSGSVARSLHGTRDRRAGPSSGGAAGAPGAARGEPATAPEPTAGPVVPVAAAVAHGGFINVWSNVWGHVDVDGREVGDSPVPHLPVNAGPHAVRVRTTRGEQSRTVVVAPDEEARARFTF